LLELVCGSIDKCLHGDRIMSSTRDSLVMTEKMASLLEGAAENVGGAAFAVRAQMLAGLSTKRSLN